MASGMNMKVLLQLQTKQFNQGINQVKKSLNGLKSTIMGIAGAIAGGLGFSKILGEIKKTATELSTAQAVLKNVSTETTKSGIVLNHYGENLSFIKDLSNKYNQEQINLIKGFAQFSAAATTCNVSLDEQRRIYEALTRAAAGYHMSASQSNDMMIAVTQMMSKGKVTAEELRRQLGNSLPGAFGIMAAALGVSTAQLEDMMKKGQVMSKDALPKFAAALEVITKDMSFDSLQGSLNRFKNSWTELVENMKAGDIYKNMIEGGASAFKWISNSLGVIKSMFVGLITTIMSYKIFNSLIKGWNSAKAAGDKYFNELTAKAKHLQIEIDKLAKKSTFPQVKNGQGGVALGSAGTNNLINNISQNGPELAKEISQINHDFMQLYETNKKLGKSSWVKAHKADYEVIKRDTKQIDDALIACGAAQNQASKGAGMWKNILGAVKSTVAGLAATFASMGIMALISAAIGGVTTLLTRIKEERKEEERIANIYNDHLKDVKKIDEGTESVKQKLASNLRVLKQENMQGDIAQSALNEINKQLGLTEKAQLTLKDGYAKINGEVDKWVEGTKKAAQISLYADKLAAAIARKKELENNIDEAKSRLKAKGLYEEDENGYAAKRKIWGWLTNNQDNQDYDTITHGIKELEGLDDTIKDCEQSLDELHVQLSDYYKSTTDSNGNIESNLKKITKVYDEYNAKAKALRVEYDKGILSTEDFNSEMESLTKSTFKSLLAFGDLNEYLKDFPNQFEKFNSFSEKIGKDFAMYKMFENTEKKGKQTLKRLSDYYKEFIGKDLSMPVLQPSRDTRLDYQYITSKGDYNSNYYEQQIGDLDNYITKLEDLEETLTKIKIKYGTLDEASQRLFGDVQKELQKAYDKSQELKDKSAVAQWMEDMEEAKKNLQEADWDAWTNGANSIERVANGIKGIKDAWVDLEENKDADTWDYLDAILSTMNEIVQVIETVKSVMEGIETVNTALAAVQKLEGQTELANLAEQIKLKGELAAADGVESAVAVEGEIAKSAAILATQAALKKAAVAGAAANAMQVPYPYNLVALASNMAAITAAFTAGGALQAFAEGGIVGGNSTQGDKNFIRANSGEMILTKGQQGTLFNMLNGKGGIGGNVEFKIRGADLVGTINNYSSRKRG